MLMFEVCYVVIKCIKDIRTSLKTLVNSALSKLSALFFRTSVRLLRSENLKILAIKLIYRKIE